MDMLLLVGLLPMMAVASLASEEKKVVTIKLKTTSCFQNSCKTFNDDAAKDVCPSSIMINGKEHSIQKDGFNVVVMDNESGDVKKCKNFRWFHDTLYWKKKLMADFLAKEVPSHSTVAIVFQNMCKFYAKDWYTVLAGYNLNRAPSLSYGSSIAIVVGCKGQCPYATDGSIPYTYYGDDPNHEASITVDLKGAPPGPNKLPLTDDKDVILIIGIAVGLVVMIAVVYALISCYRRKQEYQKTETKISNENITPSNNSVEAHTPYNEMKLSRRCMSDEETDKPPYSPPLPSAPPMYSDIDPMINGFVRSCDV